MPGKPPLFASSSGSTFTALARRRLWRSHDAFLSSLLPYFLLFISSIHVAIVKIRVVEAAGLPVMDSATQLTDAYAEVSFFMLSSLLVVAMLVMMSVCLSRCLSSPSFRLSVFPSFFLFDGL